MKVKQYTSETLLVKEKITVLIRKHFQLNENENTCITYFYMTLGDIAKTISEDGIF